MIVAQERVTRHPEPSGLPELRREVKVAGVHSTEHQIGKSCIKRKPWKSPVSPTSIQQSTEQARLYELA